MVTESAAQSRRGRGRPASGVGANGQPEKVSEYRRMTVLLPPEIKNRLEAVSTLQHAPAWRVIAAAIESYIGALPVEDRKAVEMLAQRMES